MLKQGTEIHFEKPFVHVLLSNLRQMKCDNCYGEYELLKCSACQYVRYCDRKCQKLAWNLHKIECCNFQKLPACKEVPTSARLLARLIFRLKCGGDQEKGFYDRSKIRFFKDFISHYTDIKNDSKRMEHVISLYGVLKDFIGEENLPNFSEFTAMYGRMVINSFNIHDGEMTNLGVGIYLGASTIDHSCEPNAVAVFSGTNISIRAIKDITDFKWSKVRISYIDVLKSTVERRSALLEQYYFLCDCPRCDSLTIHNELENSIHCEKCLSAINCQMCEGKTRCSNCDWTVPERMLLDYNDIVSFTKEQHQVMNSIAYFDACKVCLSKQTGILHKYNVLHVKTMDLAFESAIELGMWEDSLLLGDALAEGYQVYYGPIHPILGLHYMKFGKILLLKDKTGKALEILEKAQDILRITHGTEHDLYKVQLYRLLFEAKSSQFIANGI